MRGVPLIKELGYIDWHDALTMVLMVRGLSRT